VFGYKSADFRRDFGAKTGPVKHAVMADARLEMVLAKRLGKAGA
jgi:hypothetical protein